MSHGLVKVSWECIILSPRKLLDGLGKVWDGFEKVSVGLGKVSDGLRNLSDCLRSRQGVIWYLKMSVDLGKVLDGLGKVSYGLGNVSDGCGNQDIDNILNCLFFLYIGRQLNEILLFSFLIIAIQFLFTC